MNDNPRAPFDPTQLRIGRELRIQGFNPAREGWHRVRRGIWLAPDVWSTLTVDQKYEALVYATALACEEPTGLVLAAHSAAALWGLPIIEKWPNRLITLTPESRSGTSKHVLSLHGPEVEPVRLRGLQVTPVARTVIDLACAGTLDDALAAADRALRRELCTREELEAEALALPKGVRGRAQAQLIPVLADGLSETPGESLSRLQMFRANFPQPVLQQEYSDTEGYIGRVDFDLEGLIGEFDGFIKYKVPEDASPAEASEIVWREKRREDRLRRFKPVARWDWKIARPAGVLARHLMSFGVKPLPKNTWIDLAPRKKAS